MELTHRQYWTEVIELASYIGTGDFKADHGQDASAWDILAQKLESHDFLIYDHNAKSVMICTNNEDAFFEVDADLSDFDSYGSLVLNFAQSAMWEDVRETIKRMEFVEELND